MDKAAATLKASDFVKIRDDPKLMDRALNAYRNSSIKSLGKRLFGGESLWEQCFAGCDFRTSLTQPLAGNVWE